MTALVDTLAHLHAQSHQIVEFSNANYRPSGPFTKAVLQSHDILSLIRDAEPSESRLFKFVGEESTGNKKVEKRDGGVVTPLKELKKVGANVGEKDNTMAILKTAMTLVDDYRPMPRAKNHIRELIDAHQAQSERVAELERLIQEAVSGASQPETQTSAPTTPAMSIDEAIKAETQSIKQLEALLAPHRPAAPSSTPAPPTSFQPQSPSPTKPQSNANRTPAKTPLSSRTPNNIHIANSLVNGTTPRRVQQPFSRFSSPLKLLGTPRTAPRSVKRDFGQDDEDDIPPRTIFSKGSILRNSTSLRRSVNAKPSPESIEDADDTVRLGSIDSIESPIKPSDTTETAILAASPVKVQDEQSVLEDTTPRSSPVKSTKAPVVVGPRKVEGVEVESDHVVKSTGAVYTIWSEILRQGLTPADVDVANDPEAIVKHLHKIARSDPDSGPSDSSSISSLSTDHGRQAPPVTSQIILLAQLLLLILRSKDGLLPLQSAKESLESVARARGWEGDEEHITRIIYVGVGKRILKIDRKGGGGGRLCFAV